MKREGGGSRKSKTRKPPPKKIWIFAKLKFNYNTTCELSGVKVHKVTGNTKSVTLFPILNEHNGLRPNPNLTKTPKRLRRLFNNDAV
jgi:hypothetical protein